MNVLSSDVHVPSGHANEGSCGLASNSEWIRSNDQKNINNQVVSIDPKSQAVQNPGLSEQIFQVSDGYNKETQCEFGMEGGMVGWWIGVMSKSNVQCRKGKVVDVDLPKFLILCFGWAGSGIVCRAVGCGEGRCRSLLNLAIVVCGVMSRSLKSVLPPLSPVDSQKAG